MAFAEGGMGWCEEDAPRQGVAKCRVKKSEKFYLPYSYAEGKCQRGDRKA